MVVGGSQGVVTGWPKTIRKQQQLGGGRGGQIERERGEKMSPCGF